jgi:hypothetical protein
VPAGNVYTERFLRVTAANVWFQYQVPAAHRAVVTCIAAFNSTAGVPGICACVVAGVAIYHRKPGADSTDVVALRIAAYQGEIVQAVCTAAGLGITVGGYLFEDLTGATAAPGEISLERLETPTLLPA